NLAKVLEHPDAPNVVMAYLLSLDISDWNPQDIPATKMKTDTMMEHLANPIRFIIDHILSWPENRTEKPICSNLYQDYRIWCERNGENSFTSKKFGKTPPTIGIERKQVRTNGKREWVYILDRSKIIAKLRESIGDIEEFADLSQTETSPNTSTDLPIFNIHRNFQLASSSVSIAEQWDKVPTDISPSPEIVHVELIDDKSKPVSGVIKPANDKVEPSPIESVENEPHISPDLPANYKSELSNNE
ncbi:121_t:CDS:2, partial [Paraglomus brasilianum]